jgi:hypothetical protein
MLGPGRFKQSLSSETQILERLLTKIILLPLSLEKTAARFVDQNKELLCLAVPCAFSSLIILRLESHSLRDQSFVNTNNREGAPSIYLNILAFLSHCLCIVMMSVAEQTLVRGSRLVSAPR